MNQRTLQTTCLAILTIVVVFAVLYQTKTIFAPIISALLLGVIVTPLSKVFDRVRIPLAISAFLVVSIALMVILVLLLLIEPYVTKAFNRAPVIWDELRSTIEEFRRMLRGIEELSEDMADAIEPDSDVGGSADGGDEGMGIPTLSDALFYAPQFAAQFLIFTGTLYFFLMVRYDLADWLETTFPLLEQSSLTEATRQVSRYVLTISAINLGLGVLTGIAMHLLGMPSPVLWGILAFALNFILYLGPIALISMLLVTGIVVFDGPGSFAPAVVYMMMNATEAQFVTPTLVGRSLSVNPLLVFLSLVFWLWLWGPIGGIIAIPILIWVLTVSRGVVSQTISSGTPGKSEASASAGPAA